MFLYASFHVIRFLPFTSVGATLSLWQFSQLSSTLQLEMNSDNTVSFMSQLNAAWFFYDWKLSLGLWFNP